MLPDLVFPVCPSPVTEAETTLAILSRKGKGLQTGKEAASKTEWPENSEESAPGSLSSAREDGDFSPACLLEEPPGAGQLLALVLAAGSEPQTWGRLAARERRPQGRPRLHLAAPQSG